MFVFLFKEAYVAPRKISLSFAMAQMGNKEKSKAAIACRALLQNCVPGTQLPESKLPPVILFNSEAYYNGIVLLEIDHLSGDSEMDEIKRKATKAAQTMAVFKGISGESLKILVRFTLPGGKLPQRKEHIERFHAHAYLQAVNFYRMLLGITIAYQHTNYQRGCRMSFDPDIYFHPEVPAIPLEQPLQMPKPLTWEESRKQDPDPLERLLPGMGRNRRISLLYETSLREALDYFGGFSDDDHKLFLIRLAENCCRSGIPEEEAVKWTAFHSELNDYEVEFRTTIRNVYILGKKYGLKPCINASQRLSLQLKEFMQRRYEFRRNEVKKEVEYREKSSYQFGFAPVTDESLNTFSLQAHQEGLNFWDRDIKRYVYSNYVSSYNPIDYYLDHLPEWDGTDYIRRLAETIPTNNKKWPDMFYRWFIGMAAQWKQMSQTHANSIVPLLAGPQGCGKSTWCRNLIPPFLREYYTDRLDFGNKRDAELALHRFALINLDEFDSISLRDQPFLKHLLQKPEINIRRPYKSSTQLIKRYGVFIATCNNFDLLTDPTGSRRFLCVEIDGQIDTGQTIDIDQAFAQAVYALQQGERYWFDKDEERFIVDDNRAFQLVPAEEQLLLRYFDPADPDEEGQEALLAIEIINRLQKRGKIKLSQLSIRHFSRILTKHQIPCRRTMKGNVFFVKERE